MFFHNMYMNRVCTLYPNWEFIQLKIFSCGWKKCWQCTMSYSTLHGRGSSKSFIQKPILQSDIILIFFISESDVHVME